MTKKPPDKQSNSFPQGWKRLPFWLRCSDQHPGMESHLGEIVEGTSCIFKALCNLRSLEPDNRGFSWFSLRPASPETQAKVPGTLPQPACPRPQLSLAPPARGGSTQDQQGVHRSLFPILTCCHKNARATNDSC